MNERPAPTEPVELTDQELLRTYNEELLQTYNARNYINEERVMAATIAGLRAVIAADRARRAAPVEPADHVRGGTEMVAPTVAEIDAEWFAAWSEETGRYDVVQFARNLLAKFGQQLTPPAEGEVIDLVDCVQAWAARLDEGTPEERLLGRVAYVLRQRQAPPHEGEVDALIKILSRIAGMLDFMPDGPPDGLVIHRAIELLRQLTPPDEGEAHLLAEWMHHLADERIRYPRRGIRPHPSALTRTGVVLQQQAAELAQCREALRRVPCSSAYPVAAGDGNV